MSTHNCAVVERLVYYQVKWCYTPDQRACHQRVFKPLNSCLYIFIAFNLFSSITASGNK